MTLRRRIERMDDFIVEARLVTDVGGTSAAGCSGPPE